MIKFSAPGKVHLLGEWSVVWGKPAILATVDLKVTIHLRGEKMRLHLGGVANLKEIIEPIIKKHLKLKTIPSYNLEISSQLPIGAGLGSSAAVSACYIAALLSFLKVKWDLNLVNNLTFEAERVFHGNPSGGDNSTVVFGGLVWFRKESSDLKIIQKLSFSVPAKLAKKFVLINTGTPKETTKQMIEMVSSQFPVHSFQLKKFLDQQEQLVRELLPALKNDNEKELIRIIRAGEKNLESIGVVSPSVKSIIRAIEKVGGAAKICGAGGKTGPTGVLLAYHEDKTIIEKVAKTYKLSYFNTALDVEGLKQER